MLVADTGGKGNVVCGRLTGCARYCQCSWVEGSFWVEGRKLRMMKGVPGEASCCGREKLAHAC